ncbi:polysaccharide deacetylase family protein [Roseovarius sp. SYSU LYC5161]|uniref:polysaccharide deacetylase family protein n=1 Tax=Roseovarius halophilus (ex Wu et al. 2025) TaxID=3376060 RepID=UPI00399B35E2
MTAIGNAYEPSRGVMRRIGRKWTALRRVAPLTRDVPGFCLSICFDDVPVSAATVGAETLDRHEVAGTWHIATGLFGTTGISGEIAGPGHVRGLADSGHEVALHGHAHEDMSRMTPDAALADIARNRAALSDLLGHAPSGHFAYPFGATTLALKKRLVGEVTSARGVLAGRNGARTDAMQLAAHDLRPDPRTVARARAAMASAAQGGGWIILFTHDVTPEPSPYGISPETLDRLIAEAKALGAMILPTGQVWRRHMTGAHEQAATDPADVRARNG